MLGLDDLDWPPTYPCSGSTAGAAVPQDPNWQKVGDVNILIYDFKDSRSDNTF